MAVSGTSGDWSRLFINGIEATADIQASLYNMNYEANAAPHENKGVHTYSAGIRNDNLSLNNAYRRHSTNGQGLHALLSAIDDGNTDVDLVISEVRGYQKPPVVGDLGYMYHGGLHRYDPVINPSGIMTVDIAFAPRGGRAPAFPRYLHGQDGAIGSFTSTPVDMGASVVGLALGAVAHLHIPTPTGVNASGTITVAIAGAAADTVVVGGVTFTFVAALTGVANQVLIGATAAETAINLWKALVQGDGAGVAYVAGTAAPSTCRYVAPAVGSGLITVNYKTSGIGGNAFTLVKTGTTCTVSGATLSGGTAGDTYTFKLQTATTSGGSYTDKITFAANGQLATAERVEIAVGTSLDRWWRINAVTVGTTHLLGVHAFGGLFYNT